VLDTASAWVPEAEPAELRRFVRGRPERAVFETLLSAAGELAPDAPGATAALARAGIGRAGWRTVRRVGRARLVAVAGAPSAGAAGRRIVYAQALAADAPRAAAWLAAGALRRAARAARRLLRAAALGVAGAGAGAAGGCSDATHPTPIVVPPLVFVSDADGYAQLFRLRNDTVVRLTTTVGDDRQPQSAAGWVVFASNRDGNYEIYLTDVNGSAPRRVTTNTYTDSAPALDPTGQRIAFVSDRGGTPRLWVVDTSGANPSALFTGSQAFVPELAPAWSPSGAMIAFTSTRTGTSQVFVMPAAGAMATQVSHEATGAFDPTWVTEGDIIYTALGGAPHLVRVTIATGETRPFASDARGLGEASCAAAACVAVAGPGGADGDLVAISTASGRTAVALGRAANDRQPAVIP
jgi:Tol biopolymer transport system component